MHYSITQFSLLTIGLWPTSDGPTTFFFTILLIRIAHLIIMCKVNGWGCWESNISSGFSWEPSYWTNFEYIIWASRFVLFSFLSIRFEWKHQISFFLFSVLYYLLSQRGSVFKFFLCYNLSTELHIWHENRHAKFTSQWNAFQFNEMCMVYRNTWIINNYLNAYIILIL